MSSSSLTKHRIFQWMGIILALSIIAVGYYYYRSQASTTINKNISSDSLSEGLAGYWKLDDGSGTSATDSSTNGNAGTLTNGPTWTTGQVGGALDFDGSNDYVTMGDQSIHEGMAKIALAGWIKMDTLPATNYFMISKSSGIGQYRLAVSSGGVPTFVIATTNNAWYSSGTTASGSALTTGTWIHLLGTYDGQYVRLYVNGVLVGTGSQAISGSIVTDTSEFRLSYDSYGNYFNGQIDEVRLYNRALTSEEAANLYRLTSPTGVDTSLKGYWSFNGSDVSGTTAYDRSGAGNNGTLTNGPTKAFGKVGQALSFDGSNDYVSIPHASALNAYPLTVTTWFKTSTTGGTRGVVNKYLSSSSNGWNIFFDTSDNLCAWYFKDVSNYVYAGGGCTLNVTGLKDNQWHFVSFVVDSSGGNLYVDGVSRATRSWTGTPGATTTTQEIRVGNYPSGTDYFNGKIDEVRVYNTALTAAQIKSLYDAGQSDKTNSSASQSAGTGRLDSGLAGYWKLDDGSGTSATDSSTNSNTGTLTNGPTWTTGQVGGAVDFDGTDDYITVADNTVNSITGALTVSAWIKNDLASATANKGIVAKWIGLSGGSLVDQRSYQIGLDFQTDNNNPKAQFIVSSDGTSTSPATATGTTVIGTSSWYHVTGVFIPGKSAAIYVNGVKEAEDTSSVPSAIYDSTSALNIGIQYCLSTCSGSSYYFDGKLDEVRIYNRALSADEVADLYRLTSPTGVDTSLKGYWSFNGSDVSGTTAYDRSGAGNTGILTGGPTVTPGKIGQGIDFDGSDDYVVGTDSASLDFDDTADFTLTGWFNRKTATTIDMIIAKKSGLTSSHIGYVAYVDSASDKLVLELCDGTDEYLISSTATFTTAGWHHFAVVWDQDSAANSEIYIDGIANNATDTGTIGNIGSLANSLAYSIGAESDGDGTFDGSIDEVRVYSRALSAAEIKGLYDVGASDTTNSSVSQPQGTGRLDSGLAGYWKLDDGSGTSATDSSSNGNTGTLTNSPTWTTGQIGSAVDFDGTDDYITVADTDTLDITDSTNFALSGWFNRDTATTDDTIVAKSNGQTSADTGYNIYIDDSTDKVTFVAQDGTDQYKMESVSTFTATGWHHFALSWSDSSSSETKLFIDGTAEAVTTTGTFANVNSLANAVAFRLGAESDNGNPFDGKLDEIRLYNRALSADEVAQLYRLTSPTGVDTSLKGYWSFNGSDVSGTTVYDRSGVGNSGTLTNGPAKALGKIGQALNFDGSDDYVDAGTASAIQSLDQLSVSAWINIANYPAAGDDYIHAIVSTQNDSGSFSGWTFSIGSYADSAKKENILFEFRNVGNTAWRASSASATELALNTWYHVVATYDQSNIKVYINGVIDTTTAQTDAIADGPGLYMGRKYAGSAANRNWEGKIDEVRVYNRALSAAEVQSLYNQGK